ncbi:MAG: serine/threonine protein kinase [Verrucomicrobiales bacterium]|nr:serine/threonine protein kinase [Verrucomicrobiales bacterium]
MDSKIDSNSAAQRCGQCGSPIKDQTPDGLCIGCLLSGALSSFAEEEHEKAAAANLLQRREIAGYELLGEIARGGMGVVFRARQRQPDRLVALKVIAAGELASPRMVERFHAETEAAARLDHSNIASIYEVGEEDGWHFFSMRLIDGPTLALYLAGQPLQQREAAELLGKIARTVHHAHQRGVLHRDIKPNNILLDSTGEPILTDFGLAKIVEADSSLTRSQAVLGTPAYMPPEQASGGTRDVTVAADVYGLGAVLYEMLTGQPPFTAPNTPALLRKIVEDEPVTPSVIRDGRRKEAGSRKSEVGRATPCAPRTGSDAPAPYDGAHGVARPTSVVEERLDRDLEVICLKCLEKEPGRRYTSAAELADDLERWLRREPILARPAGGDGTDLEMGAAPSGACRTCSYFLCRRRHYFRWFHVL